MTQTPKVPRSLLLRAPRSKTPVPAAGPRLLTRSMLEARRAARARQLRKRAGTENAA